MLGTKFYKGKYTDEEYYNCACWCNENNATIEDKGEYYECVEIPPYVPTIDEIKKQLTDTIQAFMDETAQSRGYDSIASACSYANDFEPNETFKVEGKACVLWRSAVWSYCYEQLALFEAGQREVPEDIIAELPVLEW